MGKIVYNANQVKFGGKGYLDAKMQPVSTVNDLPSEVTEIFNGLSVVVLSDDEGKQSEYWRVNGQWVKKTTGGGEHIKPDWDAEPGEDAEILNKPDLSGFITKSVDDLVNYYTKTEVDSKIDDIQALKLQIVEGERPETGDSMTLYVVRKEISGENKYDEWLYINGAWELVGTTDIDLSEYAKKAEVATAITEAMDEAVIAAAEYTDSAKTDIEAWISGQGFADASAITEQVETAMADETARTESTYAKKSDLENYTTEEEVATAITEAIATKQDAFETGDGLAIDDNDRLNVLIDGVTIKLNGSNKLYADVSGTGGTYTAGEYIQISGNEISVTGITPDEYAIKDEVATAITESESNVKDWVDEQGFLKEVPAEYAKLDDVATATTASEEDVKEWVNEQGFITGVSQDIATKEDVATAITESEENTKDWIEEQGFTTEAEVNSAITASEGNVKNWVGEQGFITENEVESAITESEYNTKAWVEQQGFATAAEIATAITESEAEVKEWVGEQGFLTEVPTGYTTAEELASAITASESNVKDWVGEQGFLTEVPAEYATMTDVNNAVESGVSETRDWVTAQDYASNDEVATAITEAVATKQDAFDTGIGLAIDDNNALNVLVDGVTIKINGSNKLYAETSSTGGTYSAGQYIDITGNEISVTGITPDEYATKTELADEVSARTEAIEELAGQIEGFATVAQLDAEVTARTAADEALAERIDNCISAEDLEEEITARTAADEVLSEAIADEASARTAADEILGDQIADVQEDVNNMSLGLEEEVTARTAADEALSEALAEEASARTELEAALTAETQDRIDADFEIISRFAEYPTAAEVSTAITESAEETKAWVEEQDYASQDDIADMATKTWVAEEGYVKANEMTSAITEAKQETFDAAVVWVEGQGYLKDVPGGYVTAEEVATAITESENDIKDWVDAQGFITGVSQDLATKTDVATAITESENDVKDWVDEQGFLTEVPTGYTTTEELNSAITSSENSVKGWVNQQGFLTEVPSEYVTEAEVNSAMTDVMDWVDAQEFATTGDVATAMTSAVATANAYTDSAVSGISIPAYTISSATPDQGFASAYELKKDGQSISGSTKINIPNLNGAAIQSPITTDVAVGHVSAGTTFSAGTTIESILRSIFVSDTPVSVGYAYYGALVTPLAESELTEANITTALTRSASATSTTPWTFRVNAGSHQIIIAVPDTFELDEALDTTNSISYYEEFFNVTSPVSPKQITINNIPYLVYNVAYGPELSRFNMEITLINA